jgi:undecaprenyl-diphosphatase
VDSIIIFGARYLFIAVVLIWLAAWLQAGRRAKIEIFWSTLIAIIIAAAIDKIVSKLYYDPRPFVSHHIQPLVAHAADNGFPSEHTLFSIALAAVLFFYRPKMGVAAFIIALLVGIARIDAHVHSPVDIAGAVLIGILAGYFGYRIASLLLRTKKPPLKPGAGRPAGPR